MDPDLARIVALVEGAADGAKIGTVPDVAVTDLQALERVLGRLHALQASLLVVAASPKPWVDEFLVLDPRPGYYEERHFRIEDVVREEIAAALRWSPTVAHTRIDAARRLTGPLSDTHAALAEGTISHRHAAEIVQASTRPPGRFGRDDAERRQHQKACIDLQRRVLKVARRGTVAQTRAAAQRAVIAVDPEGAARRRQEARCTRDVYLMDEFDGVSTLVARLATEGAHLLMGLVQAAAKAGDPSLTAGERRAEALFALARAGSGAHSAADSPSPAPAETRLDILVSLDSLLGADSGPVDLLGSVPASLDVVGDLLADPHVRATMRRLVVDPADGRLVDIGRRSYSIPQRLRDFIVTRDRTCRFPGCSRRASRCEIDHATSWNDGGPTSRANLGALCKRHHQLKTLAGWELAVTSPIGDCCWTSPAGRRYRWEPPPLFP